MHTNSIHEFDQKNVAITINITKNSRKVFSAKMDGAMTENTKDRKEIWKPPLEYVGGNQNMIAESNP